MNNKELMEHFKDDYYPMRELPDGTLAGVRPMMSTTAVFFGITEEFWEKRFCFEDRATALGALRDATGKDFEPEGYIARRE
jgi:hypothetical protein